ncbi:MAG: hypothetical protein ACKV2Q_04160 [Planctomycetaceae bacterium]
MNRSLTVAALNRHGHFARERPARQVFHSRSRPSSFGTIATIHKVGQLFQTMNEASRREFVSADIP